MCVSAGQKRAKPSYSYEEVITIMEHLRSINHLKTVLITPKTNSTFKGTHVCVKLPFFLLITNANIADVNYTASLCMLDAC